MLKLSEVLVSGVLLTALLLLTAAVTPLASSGLNIVVDGEEDDWKNSSWVCPGGSGCLLPGKDYTAWLCCNTTSTPRICQLMWRDAVDSTANYNINYTRIYLNSTGIYLLANIHAKQSDVVSLWFNSTSYKLRINITLVKTGNTVYASISYYLRKPDGSVEEKAGIGYAVLSASEPGLRTRNLEAAIPFSDISGYSPLLSGIYEVSASLDGDRMEVREMGSTITKVALTVDNYHVVYAYYAVGTTTIPVPIPESSMLITAAALISVVLLVAFIVKKTSI